MTTRTARTSAQATKLANELRTKLAILAHPVARLAIARNPDCDISLRIATNWHNGAYQDEWILTLSCSIRPYQLDGCDISAIATDCSSDGYSVHADTTSARAYKLRNGETFKVRRTIAVYQDFTPDEKDTLRALGKLQTQVQQAYCYDALVCGV